MRFSRATRGRIAYMPQLFSLYEDLSAQENVGFVAALYGIGPFHRGAPDPTTRSRWWSSTTRGIGWRATCPVACSAGSSSPARSSTARRCSSSTSRRPASIPMLRKAIWDELRSAARRGPHPARHDAVRRRGRVLRPRRADRRRRARGARHAGRAAQGRRSGARCSRSTRQRAVDPEMLGQRRRASWRCGRPAAAPAHGHDRGRGHHRRRRSSRCCGGPGIGVVGMEEHQPTFDEVFTGLVEQQRAARTSTATSHRAGGGRPWVTWSGALSHSHRPDGVVHRQGAARGHPAARRPAQPDPGPVPDHVPVRPRLQRLPRAVRHRDRGAGRQRLLPRARRTTPSSRPGASTSRSVGNDREGAAEQRLRDGEIDLLVVAPENAVGRAARRAPDHDPGRLEPGRPGLRPARRSWRPRSSSAA